MFTLNVIYTMKPGMGEAYVKELESSGVAAKVRAEAGCLCYDYYYPADGGDRVFLLEQWESVDAQAVHMTQPHMAQLAEIKGKYVLSTVVGKLQPIAGQ